MSKKIKLVIDKVEYQLPINAYVAKPTYGGTPYIHMSAKHTASIINLHGGAGKKVGHIIIKSKELVMTWPSVLYLINFISSLHFHVM